MSNQQILLIILVIIIVGVGIAVGISLFQEDSIEASRAAIVQDLQVLASQARQYYVKPYYLGGGNRDFTGVTMNKFTRITQNENGRYYIQNATATQVTIVGVGWLISDDDSIRVSMQVSEQSNRIQILN